MLERIERRLGISQPQSSLITPNGAGPRVPPPAHPPAFTADPWLVQDPWFWNSLPAGGRVAEPSQDTERWPADRWAQWNPSMLLPPNMEGIPLTPSRAPRRGAEIGPQGQRRPQNRVHDDDDELSSAHSQERQRAHSPSPPSGPYWRPGEIGRAAVEALLRRPAPTEGSRPVARSTFAAELLSAGDATDQGLLLAQQLHEMLSGPLDSTAARELRLTGGFAVPMVLVVDAMSVFAAVIATFIKTPAETVIFVSCAVHERTFGSASASHACMDSTPVT